ncbi:hypothetical protein [Microcoleus sp. D2_18a_D3]|uniref:hypothetical protein n=1 Tax=Microcoleus sp. D2_18a_D3 TaxID=3055330 RepID=UPI002FCF7A02
MSNTSGGNFSNERLNKLSVLHEMGINPYPSYSEQTDYVKAIIDDDKKQEGQTVTIAGRLVLWHVDDALTLGYIQDQTGQIPIFLRQDVLKSTDVSAGNLGYSHLNLLDVDDFIQVSGTVIKSQGGETSVLIDTLRLLSKSLNPLPNNWVCFFKNTTDIVLTIEDFQNLISDKILHPPASKITIYPYLIIWNKPNLNGNWRASGYVEVDGILENNRLRITGYTVTSQDKINAKDESDKFIEIIELELEDIIIAYFNKCQVQIAEVVQVRAPG